MELLERSAELARLDAVLDEAVSGSGSMVLVSGEAGIGKTRLVADWTESVRDRARIAWGACDDLITPIVLGPFHDLARELGGSATGLFTEDNRAAAFGAMLEALGEGIRPTVAIVEDVHWADAATFDVLEFLARRIRRSPAMLLVTFRGDEVDPAHPLRQVLGDLPPDAVHRLELAPLSGRAVAQLAAPTSHSATEVYALTRGNPFLVSEVLAAGTARVPTTVADAVLARMARLSDDARRVAETVSVVPGRCERWLLSGATTKPSMLEECRRHGLLELGPQAVWFRHELSRRAVEDSLDAARARLLHGRVLGAMLGADVDPARVVHHAERARDADALVRFAPVAARKARAAAAHREAYSHYGQVLPYLDRLSPLERVALLSEYTAECYYVDDAPSAIDAAQQALALYRELGDRRGEGAMLRWISRVHWWTGSRDAAMKSGSEAIGVLESIYPTAELAMAYSNLAQLHMLAHEAEEAIHWATKAIDTARVVGAPGAEAHALNNLGSARIRIGDEEGWEMLRQSLALSLDEGLDEHAARAYSNLGWTLLDVRDYAAAGELLEEGIAFTSNREIHGDLYYMVAERARMLFETGDLAGAAAEAQWVLARPRAPGITTLPALTTLGRVAVRRGAEDAGELLWQAWQQALPTGELQRMGPVAVGRAEHAWLRDDPNGVADAIAPVLEAARSAPQPWVTDEMVFWWWRSGAVDIDEVLATPFALQVAGEWRKAAETWAEIGCPYEQACALGDGDQDAVVAALEIFDRLGAVPAAAMFRRRLRDLGVTSVPRGPRPSTRRHPLGLTPRQQDVLELLAEGRSNSEIAARLYVASKTVEHHVSAILTKLGVASRAEAVERAAETGAVEPSK